MERVILHCDLNSFYASVEELYHPESRGQPIAVGGSVDERHGIILAKNQIAKKYKVETAEAIWQAKKKCPQLVIYPPNYPRYLLFSNRVRAIFHEYTDLVEPFGLDEAWLDVTASSIYGNGIEIADTLRRRIFEELGVTASVGVSFNKIFAKLGSDLRKPNYTTVITRENYREMIGCLDVGDLLYVGKSTAEKLKEAGISTIGELADAPVEKLHALLGKWGIMLSRFANGEEDSPVARFNHSAPIKSIGNSVTCYRDLMNQQDLEIVLQVLCESVASRLREQGLKAQTVALYFRGNDLVCFSRQMKTESTDLANEIMNCCRTLYRGNYFYQKPLRSIGVRAADLTCENRTQLSLFINEENRRKQRVLEDTMDHIRERFGFESVKACSMLLDPALSNFNPKDDHIIHPESFMR